MRRRSTHTASCTDGMALRPPLHSTIDPLSLLFFLPCGCGSLQISLPGAPDSFLHGRRRGIWMPDGASRSGEDLSCWAWRWRQAWGIDQRNTDPKKREENLRKRCFPPSL